MHARTIVAVGLAAALAAAPPATAQTDPLGLGREFGAYVDPSTADAMIRECDAQAREVETGATAFLALMRDYVAREDEYWGRIDEVNAAGKAVAEAEARLGQLSGAEADRFAREILTPRRERFQALSTVLPMHTSSRDSFLRQASRAAEATMARLRAAGVPEADFAAPAAEISRRAAERCRRMRAWAQLGVQARARSQAPADPAPSGSGLWPEGAIAAWQGRWSCRITTALGREVVTADLPVRISAVLERGLLRVSGTPAIGQLPSGPMFRLDVRADRPADGEFQDPNGVGEGGRPSAMVDTAQLTGDGRLTLRRRYVDTPAKSEFMACTRIGPL